jgi:small-conductance mechanosensitive channel
VKKLTSKRLIFYLLGLIAVTIGIGWAGSRIGSLVVGQWSFAFLRIFTEPYFHIGQVAITPVLLFKVLAFVVLLGIVSGQVRKFMQGEVLVHTSMDLGQQFAVARITGYLIFVVGLVVGLESLGVDLSSLVVLGGAVGVGVGFGLQNIVNNFVSGLILLIERPIKLGDRVEVGATNGDVVRIAGRSTWVRTNENVVIIIPNSEFISTRVTNWTANDRQVRFSLALGVSYSSRPSQVRELLMKVALAHPDVLQDPPPEVIFCGFGDSALNFELRVWTIRQVQTSMRLKSDLYFAVFAAFAEDKIEIPFPQRDLHVRSISAPIILGDRA